MRLLAVIALLFCSGCSTTFPHCFSSNTDSAAGRWVYSRRLLDPDPGIPTPASQIGRPREVELLADGSFHARFDASTASSPGSAAVDVPTGTVTGHWQGGTFCAESLFAPWVQVGTDPRLPNTGSIQIEGGHLLILGPGSSADDCTYDPRSASK